MPHNPGSPQSWLRFAKADLAVATEPLPPDGLYEILCFHAQQAAEKALKALFVKEGITPPRTHNLKILFESLPITSPTEIQEAAKLTAYAVMTRYPGDLDDPVDEEEYRDALRLAKLVFSWVETIL